MDDNTPNTNNRQETETPAPLQDTVWKWSNTITLKFISATQAQLSGDTLAYSYNETTRAGTIVTVGSFTINEDGTSLVFTDYKSLGGRTFTNANSAIIGSQWSVGKAVLQFGSAKITLYTLQYTYTYDNDSKTGNADFVGPFTITGEGDSQSITFSDYKTCGHEVTFVKGTAAEQTFPLLGTAWDWGGDRIIEFVWPEGISSLMTRTNDRAFTFYDQLILHTDTSGWIEYCGEFQITNNWQNMYFPQYAEYPHDATFTRLN
jgi:hypothetical protein